MRVKAELLLNVFCGGKNKHELSFVNIDNYADIRRFAVDCKVLQSAKQFLTDKGYEVVEIDFHPFNKK